jgi:hypothetical protein
MTLTKHTVPHNSIEAEALRCERDAVISEFKQWTAVLMEETGWNEGVAAFVTKRIIRAHEIGIALRESRVGTKMKGKKLTAPPAAFVLELQREVYALTQDPRAVVFVELAFLSGWERNRRDDGGAPKKTAGATVLSLMKRRTGKSENDRRFRLRVRERLEKIIEEFRSRSPSTVLSLMKRTGETENDKRERMRKHLEKMVEEFRSRSP